MGGLMKQMIMCIIKRQNGCARAHAVKDFCLSMSDLFKAVKMATMAISDFCDNGDITLK